MQLQRHEFDPAKHFGGCVIAEGLAAERRRREQKADGLVVKQLGTDRSLLTGRSAGIMSTSL